MASISQAFDHSKNRYGQYARQSLTWMLHACKRTAYMWQDKPCGEASVNTASCTEPCVWLRAAGGYVESAASIISLLCLQFIVHAAMCPDISGRICTEWHIQLWCHCAEDYQLPNKQMKVKGQGSAMAGGSHTDVCRTHTAVTGCIWLNIFLISS